ncbi:hypothetical protein QRD89_04920 [Halobacillus sp. ACCC02827]|uniref:hypothetical protein n=1 Tax=Bacillaceae TaxID=186817 RepID=UPI0002E133BB|nr:MULTISPECIES: hypothetical protein [Bacillaceae]QHT45883.1 hypothetical protein M662_05050 [Bacillus sp. SB49]WJE16689.1 hypothetical protein QRD89_04920 [Halobacillus sp. ACCC02827]
MNQSLISSVLFLISAFIWALLAIIYEEFRLLNFFLFITFLVIGLAKRRRYQERRDYEED